MGTVSERIIQEERNSRDRAGRFYNGQVKDHLTPMMQSFVKKQHMLFIATNDAERNCDCSPRFG
jgi:predicted pyridoxine 5'-phosphate oxidase superfamily flavin-nucleotide-binding protein